MAVLCRTSGEERKYFSLKIRRNENETVRISRACDPREHIDREDSTERTDGSFPAGAGHPDAEENCAADGECEACESILTGEQSVRRRMKIQFALSSAFFLCHNAMRRIAGQTRSAGIDCGWRLPRLRARGGAHDSPRAANWKPYAVSVFSAAVCPARDKVPCRTDFSLRRAPPYFLSTGQENVREPHSPRLFFAQTVKRCACGFFFVLFLCGKKKNKDFPLLEKGKRCSFLRKEKRTGRFTEIPASDSQPQDGSHIHTAPVMTDSRVLRVHRGQSRKIIYTLLKLGHTISYIPIQCYALQGKLAVRVPSAAGSSHACGRGVILRYFLMRAGLSTKNSLFPKQEKPSF